MNVCVCVWVYLSECVYGKALNHSVTVSARRLRARADTLEFNLVVVEMIQ